MPKFIISMPVELLIDAESAPDALQKSEAWRALAVEALRGHLQESGTTRMTLKRPEEILEVDDAWFENQKWRLKYQRAWEYSTQLIPVSSESNLLIKHRIAVGPLKDPIVNAAECLMEMRMTHRQVDALPEDLIPLSLNEAYQIQEVLVSKLLIGTNRHAIGYKIAATNPAAQALLNVDEPFFGILLSHSSHNSPATLVPSGFTVRCIEPEFSFEMAADVPFNDEPYSAESIRPYIAALIPSIEIVDHRYVDWKLVGAPSLAADNAIHGAWVQAAPIADWQRFDFSRHPVKLSVNGEVYSEGSGAAVLGNPLNVVAWLANELPKHGRQLKKGNKITTGTTADVYLASSGDHCVADFGELGRVEVAFA